jgi:type II secretory pathway component PulF
MEQPTESTSNGRWSTATLVVHIACPVLVVCILVFVVPKFVRMFSELGVALPVVTRIVVNLALILRRMSILALVAPIVAVGIDYGVWRLLHQQMGKQAGRVWLIFIVLCYVAYIGVMVIALFLPMIGA